jgi:hypothetical protein
MSQPSRNYIKFDFDNIKLSHTWLPCIQDLKDILIEYIQTNDFHIYNKIYKPDTLNFYSVTSKLTSLNEIYILIIFVSQTIDTFHETNIQILKDLYNFIKTRTKFDTISLYYQLTDSKMKPGDSVPIYHIDGPLDIAENIMDYRIFISPNSFTQSNYDSMIKLYTTLSDITSTSQTSVLHYYGRGMTPVCHILHSNFKTLYGYSSCKISYNDGIKSLDTNKLKNQKLSNIELLYDKSRQLFFENINKDEEKTIIISASRNGFRQLDLVNKFNRLIYIACNMKSFLQEIKDLPLSYTVLGEIDMFPGTDYKEIIMDLRLN